MENELLSAANEMELGDHDYTNFEELKENHTENEILDAWLRYEGIAGYTSKILTAVRLLDY